MRRGKKTKGLRDMDFNAIYDDTYDCQPKYSDPFYNVDSERLQEIFKKNGKVTWIDVYGPLIKSQEWRIKMGEKSVVRISGDPNTVMKCMLDLSDGLWYWEPKE